MNVHYASPTTSAEWSATVDFLGIAFVVVLAVVFAARLFVAISAHRAAAENQLTRHPQRARELYTDLINEFNMTAMAHGQRAYHVADENRYTTEDIAWVRAWDMAGEQLADWDYEEKWNQEHGRLLYNGALKSGRWHKYHFNG